MSAVRLDPFRRIVSVGWPSAVGPFRTLLQIEILSGPIYRYQLAMHLHGNQSGVYFNTDRLRGTWGGVPFESPTAPAIFFSNTLTFPGGGLHPDVSTPAGWTVINATHATAGYFLDAPLTLMEILRGGAPILSVPVSGWTEYTNQTAAYPAVPAFPDFLTSFKNRVRVK